jgi:hypothetical protein
VDVRGGRLNKGSVHVATGRLLVGFARQDWRVGCWVYGQCSPACASCQQRTARTSTPSKFRSSLSYLSSSRNPAACWCLLSLTMRPRTMGDDACGTPGAPGQSSSLFERLFSRGPTASASHPGGVICRPHALQYHIISLH